MSTEGQASTQLQDDSWPVRSAAPRPHSPGEDGAAAPREGVGVLLPEHVPHAAAGDDFQAAAALPHAEGDLCGGRGGLSLERPKHVRVYQT